ncbi:transposase [Spirillospora sp. NPDC052242]
MVKTMAEALMGAEADAVCEAGYGQHTDERVNRRNGYRFRVPGLGNSRRHHRGGPPQAALGLLLV